MKILFDLIFIIALFSLEASYAEKKGIEFETQEETSKTTTTVASETITRAELMYPNIWGLVGTFRVKSGETLPGGALTFGIGGEFYSINDSPVTSGSSSGAQTIAENLFVGYSPVEHLSLGLSRRNSSTTFGNPQQLISSLGDLYFNAAYSFALTESIFLAPIVETLIASNFNNLAPAGETVSVGFGGALTWSLDKFVGLPLWAHFNAKYHMPQIRSTGPATVQPETFFEFSRFHTVTLAAAAELKLGDLMPFIEFNHRTHTNSSLSFGKSPATMTVGLRFTPLSNKSLSFLVGGDIGLSRNLSPGIPMNPGYRIIGQVAYTVGLNTTERKHYYTTEDVGIVDRKFVIQENIQFELNSAVIKRSSYALLNQIADVIEQNKVNKLLIVGHTDSTASEQYNIKLSKDRADAVKNYLVQKRNIDADKLSAEGYGKRKPIASNASDRGRAQNRRVEFFVLD